MRIAIYSRKGGQVTFHGVQEFETPSAFLATKPDAGSNPASVEVLRGGFPDTSVNWKGPWGYAIQYDKLKSRALSLYDLDMEQARQLGEGNASAGVRKALQIVAKLDDLSQYL